MIFGRKKMQRPRYHRVEITVEHHRRYPLGFLLLGALVGWQVVSMFAFVAVILALVAWRERRNGRPF
jgi:hypothetical protein